MGHGSPRSFIARRCGIRTFLRVGAVPEPYGAAVSAAAGGAEDAGEDAAECTAAESDIAVEPSFPRGPSRVPGSWIVTPRAWQGAGHARKPVRAASQAVRQV